MRNIIVSRHPGAQEWMSDRGWNGEVISHLTFEKIQEIKKLGAKCRVIGILPLEMVAELNRASVEVYMLSMNLPTAARGKELTKSDMDLYEAKLFPVRVTISDEVRFSPIETVAALTERLNTSKRVADDLREWLVLALVALTIHDPLKAAEITTQARASYREIVGA